MIQTHPLKTRISSVTNSTSHNSHLLLNSKTGGHIDKDEQIIQLQRKLKALKDAFIKERETKGSLERELIELKKRSESHEAALREKVIEKLPQR